MIRALVIAAAALALLTGCESKQQKSARIIQTCYALAKSAPANNNEHFFTYCTLTRS